MIVLAISTSAIIWALALGGAGQWPVRAKKFEYWYAYGFFALPGLGMLFGLADIGSEVLIFILRFGFLVIFSLVYFFLNITKDFYVPLHAWPLMLWFALALAQAWSSESWLTLIATMALMLPICIGTKKRLSWTHFKLGLIDSIRLFLAAIAVISPIWAERLFGDCRSDKCSLWGVALGAEGTGNALGILIALLSAVSIWFCRNLLSATCILLSSYLMVDATSGRAALLTFIVGSIVMSILRLSSDKPWLKRLLLPGLLATVVVCITIALLKWSDEAFTFRGSLWNRSHELIEKNPWFGYGTNYWVDQIDVTGFDANYSTHNLILDIMVSSGLIGFLLVFISIAILIAHSAVYKRPAIVALITIWVASSTIEVTASLGRFYLIPGIFVIAYFYSSLESIESRRLLKRLH